MKFLVVIAHPLEESMCRALARTAIDALSAAGHTVVVEDLYQADFPPALTANERRNYYSHGYEGEGIRLQAERLREAEGLILVFPTWWFGFPAILKGWFDRVWAPGIAYDHAPDLGAIRPRLHRLRRALAITTLGSPWWVDCFLLRRPVRRVLKIALLGTCAPNCRFEMLSLYKAEKISENRLHSFCRKIRQRISRWGSA